ncbi:MAG: hypothetical protein HYV15_02255 [Elusimicrobia bacterium]|nr:hypothetical protein [Elusimicrobiota bacterium]
MPMALKKSVTVCECWLRDGLQSMSKVVPTAEKIEMANRIMAAGVRKMEVTSFSHPKLLPQFADCVEVLKGIERRPGMTYVVLMPNEKGFDRFETCVKEGYGADEVILMISSSEARAHAPRRGQALPRGRHGAGPPPGRAGHRLPRHRLRLPHRGRRADERRRRHHPLLRRGRRAHHHARRHDGGGQPAHRPGAHRGAPVAVPEGEVHRPLPRHEGERGPEHLRRAGAGPGVRRHLHRRHRRPARQRREEVPGRLHRQHLHRGPGRAAQGGRRRHGHRPRQAHRDRAPRRGGPRAAPAGQRHPQRAGQPPGQGVRAALGRAPS